MEIRRLLKNKVSLVGFILVGIVVFTCIFAPWISPKDPMEQSIVNRFSEPSAEYIAGADRFGRDIFSRTLYGSRLSLPIGLAATAFGAAVGTVLGLIAGFKKGKISDLIMWLTDIFMSFPTMVLAIIVVVAFGAGARNSVLAIGLAFVPRFIRLARASTLSVSELSYIEASRAAGQSNTKILYKHVFPNIVSDIIIMSTLWIATAIRLEASLSFLGLGAQPPTPSWGNMIREGLVFFSNAPWLSLVPGLGIFITVIGFNMLGDGLRDVLDPKLRGRLT